MKKNDSSKRKYAKEVRREIGNRKNNGRKERRWIGDKREEIKENEET